MNEFEEFQQKDINDSGMTMDEAGTAGSLILSYLDTMSVDDFIFAEYGIRRGKYKES